MRTIGVVTVARSDYGIYLPILRQIQATPDLRLQLFVSGMHLSPEFGLTVTQIEKDGFEVHERVEMLLSSDTPEGIAKSVGLGVIGFAQAYARVRPDILLVLGDRFEMLSAVVAAMPYTIPIAHIHGGEATEGLIDEPIRHSITKMSHLHLVSTKRYRERVIQLGEEPWRVTVSGAPSLDNLQAIKWLDLHSLEAKIDFPLQPPPLLVTYHPVTLEYQDTEQHISELLAALEMVDLPIVFTYPNSDTNGRIIIEAINRFVQSHERSRAVTNLGTQAYFSLMRHASAMVGNSSSGIIEAASFGLPVINIGNRQRGRIHSYNVIDVGYDRHSIVQAIREVSKPSFRAQVVGMQNPYGDGHAAKRIVKVLGTTPLDRKLILKRFYDITLGETQ
ncbi:MAG: UDP-N-acetylglucosamine 2-epimerase [Ardenticatenaceae bacterium]